jgi:hypothetical protein
MKCERGKEMLTGWMDNQLTEIGRAMMETHLAECAECRQQLETNRHLWDLMGEVSVPEPSDKMGVRFEAMLDTYKKGEERRTPGLVRYIRQLFAVRPGFTWAYSVVLVVVGVGMGLLVNRFSGTGLGAGPDVAGVRPAAGSGSEGQQLEALSAQVHEMKEMVLLSLLENPSASERIRGVSYTSEIKKVNKNVVDALLSTLNNDPNANVRLITLDALTHYTDEAAVREGLVQSILQQDSPLMQAALADVMLKLQEKRAVRPLKQLLQQKDLNEMVRTKIEQTLTRLI